MMPKTPDRFNNTRAVIAIENGRFFEEVQARTRELACSVKKHQALGDLGEVGRPLSLTLQGGADDHRRCGRSLSHRCRLDCSKSVSFACQKAQW
jgi:hypothetical protein